jgi:hypothetical protein
MAQVYSKSVSLSDLGSFIPGYDARVVMRDDESSLTRLWREKRGEAEPEDVSGSPRPTPPCYCTSANPSNSLVGGAHAEFVAALAAHPPRPIPLDAHAIDLEDRADHLDKVFGAFSVYVTVILDDTAQNVPGGLDLRDAEGLLTDLASDLTGAIQRAADDMAGRVG